ncbi:anthranilate phosphoribosyltransferase [Opitutales bacterium ASA1]|uniref:anthranilate phosphoribosyltransferase n=1 Tax=Congregicoccus parvus TaxID=3081749 RepID=UPI002B29A694|nr:anthranilate phosphoribosyltransferase [Opitutales bacterium ASA1]
MELKAHTESVAAGREIGSVEAERIARALADAAVPVPDKEAFLEAFSRRGETGAELAAFARAFRSMAVAAGLDSWASDAIDVCGTGGDRSGSFNISTTVAFALAASKVPVIKHGNRSISSHCGSADLLEAVGIRIDADETTRRRSMEELGFVFLFAPGFHPAFKEIGPVRRALAARGVRTMFNILGPLLNPAGPAHQVVGVFAREFVEPVASALHGIGLRQGLVLHCSDDEGRRHDELTTCGRNHVVGFGALRDVRDSFEAEALGLERAPTSDLAGGDASANLAVLERVLDGTAPRGLIDTIVLNTAAALFAVGRVRSIAEGLAPARDVLLGGAVSEWLRRARAFYRS